MFSLTLNFLHYAFFGHYSFRILVVGSVKYISLFLNDIKISNIEIFVCIYFHILNCWIRNCCEITSKFANCIQSWILCLLNINNLCIKSNNNSIFTTFPKKFAAWLKNLWKVEILSNPSLEYKGEKNTRKWDLNCVKFFSLK